MSRLRPGRPEDQLRCRDVVDLLTAYVDGALDAATTVRVREHLRTCPGCETLLAQLDDTARALSALPLETLPDETIENLRRVYRDWIAADERAP